LNKPLNTLYQAQNHTLGLGFARGAEQYLGRSVRLKIQRPSS